MAHKRKGAKGTKSFGIATASGILSGIATGAVLVFCLAAVAYRMSDPAAALMPMGLIALAVSALVTGRVSCAMWGNTSLFPTLASGAVYALLIAAVGLSIPGSTLDVTVRCLGCPAILLIALLGGMIGKRTTRKRSRR